jgi:NAD(P)H-hydrate epimerase
MENAGLAVVLAMEKVLGKLEGKRITIFCGKGGNGGDGMCAARHLVAHGAEVVVGLVGGKDGLKGDPLANWTMLDRTGLTPREVKTEGDLAWARAAVGAADYVVDALVGVGARLPLEGVMGGVVAAIVQAGKPVVAIDLPSGVEADTGRVPGLCVTAALTVTLALPKPGLILHPGTAHVGKLIVADLSLPPALLADPAIRADVLLAGEAVQLMPARAVTAHKHEVGRALIVAGSRAMTGAALLAAEGALVGGAGMVYLATPASVAALLHGRRPELILQPQRETAEGTLDEGAAEILLANAKVMHAVAIGPGLGTSAATRAVARRMVLEPAAAVVVDADALNVFAGKPAELKGAKGPRILTPHGGELARLLGVTADAVEADRPGSARGAAEVTGAVVVLKGARTVVAEPGGRHFLIATGNAGMATAGCGDVLAGLIAALLAQRLGPVAAALLGAHVHGLAGDLARDDLTELGVTASAVAGRIPAACKRLLAGDPTAA